MVRIISASPLGVGGIALLVPLSLVLLIFSSIYPSFATHMRVLVTDAVYPVLSSVSRPVQDGFTAIHNIAGIAGLQSENARLEKENARLRSWYHKAQLLAEENHDLRSLLNLEPETPHRFISARVLSDYGSAFARTMLVNAGAQDGVEAGQPVLSEFGAVGRIVEAGTKTSRILLLTDINSRVPVLIEGADVHAILAGDNRPLARLDHVPEGTVLAENYRVVTSGMGGIFPYGLPVGQLVKTKDGWRVSLYAALEKILFVRMIDLKDSPHLVAPDTSAADTVAAVP